MPNLNGLSDEEVKRVQALSDKTKGDFARAHEGAQPPAKDAPASEARRADATVNHVLTPNGQTRVEKTAEGHQREQDTRKMADQANARSDSMSDKAHRRADLRKSFNQARSPDKVNERDDLEL